MRAVVSRHVFLLYELTYRYLLVTRKSLRDGADCHRLNLTMCLSLDVAEFPTCEKKHHLSASEERRFCVIISYKSIRFIGDLHRVLEARHVLEDRRVASPHKNNDHAHCDIREVTE